LEAGNMLDLLLVRTDVVVANDDQVSDGEGCTVELTRDTSNER